MSGISRIHRSAGAITALLFVIAHAQGCSTPVFQYALERWDTSPYHVLVCSDSALTPGQQKRAELLKPADVEAPQPNLEIRAMDLSLKEDPIRKQLEEILGKPLGECVKISSEPQLLILWPIAYGRQNGIFWSGPMDADELKVLTDSPIRHAIARDLLSGNAIVWLLVESGDAKADQAAETVLRESLKKLESEIELPIQDDDMAFVQDPKATPPAALKPRFAVLKLKAGLPEERMFERMLRLDDYWKEKKVPLVYPIYGRGRVLGTLAGEEIGEDLIAQVAVFLTGACSCQVKEGNPGYDLLMTVDWIAGLENSNEVEKALPPLISPTGLVAAAKAATEKPTAPETIVAATPDVAPDAEPSPVIVNVLIVVGVLAGVILVAGLLLRTRRS